MRTFGRTITMLAIVGTVGLTLSGCGWFRGDDDVATTSETTTVPATTAQRPTTQMQPMTPAPTTTERQYQQSLQK